jgi:hypothetical protein
MAPAGVTGDVGPMSTTKPMSLLWLCHTILVPAFTQKRAPLFALGMFGIDEAELAVLSTLTTHGVVAEPQVLAAVQELAGFDSTQAYLFCWAVAQRETRRIGRSGLYLVAEYRFI